MLLVVEHFVIVVRPLTAWAGFGGAFEDGHLSTDQFYRLAWHHRRRRASCSLYASALQFRLPALRLRRITANVAKLFRPFDKLPLPTFPLVNSCRLVEKTVDYMGRHLDAFNAAFLSCGFADFEPARPRSTSRRIASARDGLSGCLARHLSTDLRNCFDARI